MSDHNKKRVHDGPMSKEARMEIMGPPITLSELTSGVDMPAARLVKQMRECSNKLATLTTAWEDDTPMTPTQIIEVCILMGILSEAMVVFTKMCFDQRVKSKDHPAAYYIEMMFGIASEQLVKDPGALGEALRRVMERMGDDREP